jgi:hypothetical protein
MFFKNKLNKLALQFQLVSLFNLIFHYFSACNHDSKLKYVCALHCVFRLSLTIMKIVRYESENSMNFLSTENRHIKK